jgi:hypothetical protein
MLSGAVMIVNMDGMADRYLSQHDISKLLGGGRTTVHVWRHRYPDFPEPDVQVGFGKRAVPGWRPERMDEIRAWLAAHPGLTSH